MKRVFSRLFRALPKRAIVAVAAAAAAVVLPLTSASANSVQIESTMGIANVTAGDTTYKREVNASYDQVLKVQVYYHNMEDANSGKIAENLRVKVDIPTTPGKKQVISSTVSADNANTMQDSVTVNLDRDDAYLEYIPGSAVWKHNKGTNENVQDVEEKVSDDVVYGGHGIVLEDAKPCWNFDATLTVLVRVRVPGVKIVKQSRVKGSGNEWSNNNTAKPGDTLEYLITYQNIGNTKHEEVVIRDNLPPAMTYVPGTTYLANENNPSGVKYNSDNIATGGIVIGDYQPGANAFVKFEVKVPTADKLPECGVYDFRNVGVARPKGMNEYYNTSVTKVEKECEEKPEEPKYVCDALTLKKLGDRKVEATVKYTAVNGAAFKHVVYNFGDGSDQLVTNQTTATHTYEKVGEYTVRATVYFTVDGEEKSSTTENCVAKVNFEKPEKPEEPKELPKTGVSGIVSLFGVTSAAGAAAHYVATRRRK